jgi:hypothetical protein
MAGFGWPPRHEVILVDNRLLDFVEIPLFQPIVHGIPKNESDELAGHFVIAVHSFAHRLMHLKPFSSLTRVARDILGPNDISVIDRSTHRRGDRVVICWYEPHFRIILYRLILSNDSA